MLREEPPLNRNVLSQKCLDNKQNTYIIYKCWVSGSLGKNIIAAQV